jgi:hypothetical protein
MVMGFIVALSLTPRPDYPWTPPPRARRAAPAPPWMPPRPTAQEAAEIQRVFLGQQRDVVDLADEMVGRYERRRR